MAIDADRTWTGTWETNYGKVELSQVGSSVTGVYILKQGRINGQAAGDKLVGQWAEAPSYAPPSDAGEFEIRMDQSGRSFTGKWWKLETMKEHEWSGKRI